MKVVLSYNLHFEKNREMLNTIGIKRIADGLLLQLRADYILQKQNARAGENRWLRGELFTVLNREIDCGIVIVNCQKKLFEK